MKLSISPWLFMLLITPLHASAVCYRADAADSEISFEFAIERSEFTGHFGDFELTYCWQDKPENGRIDVLINMASARTGNSELDLGMQEPEGLYSDKYPTARWRTESIQKQDKHYQASGELTIRDISRKETGLFSLEPLENGWRLTGNAMLNRLDYAIGTGEYADTEFIPGPVKVQFEFMLKATEQTLQME